MVLPAPLTIVMPPDSAGGAAAADPVVSAVTATAVDPATASARVKIFRGLPLKFMNRSSSLRVAAPVAAREGRLADTIRYFDQDRLALLCSMGRPFGQ
jgi:hypothetical protein